MRRFLLTVLAAALLSPLCEAQTLWRQTGYSVQDHDGSTGFTPAIDSLHYYWSGNNLGKPTWDAVKPQLFDVYENFPHDSSVRFFYDHQFTFWRRTETFRQTVDTSGKVTVRTKLVSNNGGISYVNYEKDEYSYDASGNRTLWNYWWWFNNQWKNTVRETYTYTGGNLTGVVGEVLNSTTNQWNNSFRRTYTYVGGKMSEELFELWQAGSWNFKNKWWFRYDGNGQRADKTYATWNNTYLTWDTVNRRGYGYDVNGNCVGDTTQIWLSTSSTWHDDERYIYEYDVNNKPVNFQWQGWSNIITGWLPFQKHLYIYNADTLLTTNERMYWNNNTSAWAYTYNSKRFNFYYESFTPVNGVYDETKAVIGITLYPNPAITQLRVNAEWKTAQPFTVAIFDMSGRLLKQWSEPATKSNSSSIPVIDMPAGSYTITLNNGEQKVSKQFSVLK